MIAIAEVEERDLGMMINSAFRYACGRMTYIVGWTCEVIKHHWDDIDENMQNVLHRDLKRELDDAEFGNRHLGMDFDHREWKELLEWIDKKHPGRMWTDDPPRPESARYPPLVVGDPELE